MANALDPSAVAAYAYAAGITNTNDLITAVAIANRESTWTPSKINPNANTGDLSYGLWQINIIDPGTKAKLFSALGISDPNQLLDPITNARAMAYLYKANGNTFYSWGPYKGVAATAGVTPAAMQQAAQGVQTAQSKGWLTPQFAAQVQQGNAMEIGAGETPGANPINTPVTSDNVSPLPDIGGLISLVEHTIFNGTWWKWVGIGALGVVLVGGALLSSDKGQQVITTATKAVAA